MREAAKGIDFLNEPRHSIDGYASSRIIHRDVKPQNLLLVGGSVKVADFGMARAMERTMATRSGGLTPAYAPPEFFQGQVTPYSDQYSLAISYCQLRSGRLPFQGDLMQVMAGHLTQPPDLTILPEPERGIVGRALAKQPRDRWPNNRSFVNELSESSSAERHQAAPPQSPPVLLNSIGMKFARIPGGRFLMGSPETELGRHADEGPQHIVTINRSFYMSVYPVTQHEYETVMGSNPSGFQGSSGGGSDHPVESVSWYEALEFCRKLSSRFEERDMGHHYYLPTEAEWEYACRAGTSTPFAFGTSLSSYQANFNGEKPYGDVPVGPFRQQTTRVGSFQPNASGLYDMHGNVWEWCADYYAAEYYRGSPECDPLGPRSGTRRVLRGGTWGWNSARGENCRSARRDNEDPSESMALYRFRVVLIPERGPGT
jgi:formylglycine-generating enzyme required for sulfatase activity